MITLVGLRSGLQFMRSDRFLFSVFGVQNEEVLTGLSVLCIIGKSTAAVFLTIATLRPEKASAAIVERTSISQFSHRQKFN